MRGSYYSKKLNEQEEVYRNTHTDTTFSEHHGKKDSRNFQEEKADKEVSGITTALDYAIASA